MKRSYVVLTSVLLAVTLLMTGFAAPAALAQDESPVTVDSARPVTEIVGEKSAYLGTVSPDGNYIAWGKQSGRGKDRVLQLCIFEFESAARQCSDLSTELFDGYPYQFQWSPDSSMIAFSETPPEIGSESDIWLFDRAAGTFTNLTDDGLVGLWNYINADGEQSVLDYLPMWNTADGQIYFWRVVPLGNFRYTMGVYRIAPEGGEAELVRDLTTNFADRVPLFDLERMYLDGISALSPDGSTVAIILTSFDEMGASEQSLWAIDLTEEGADPQPLAGLEDFRSARPEWAQDFPPQALGLAWTDDGAGVVVMSYSEVGPTMPFQVFQYVDVASGEITPIVDFSGVEEMDDYGEPAPGSDLPWRVYSPWTASLSPAGDKLLMVNDLGGTVALFTAPLPPTGDLPTVSASADESPMSGVATSSRGEGGKVVAYGLLMTITEE